MPPAAAAGASGRVLLVRRGSPPAASAVLRPHPRPGVGEVLVHVRAAALTATDVLLCSGPGGGLGAEGAGAAAEDPTAEGPGVIEELLRLPGAEEAFVPGTFFFGEVLALGAYVEGIAPGELVLGLVDGAGGGEGGGEGGGCYREGLCVHYSCLLPASELAVAGLHMPSVVAHVPAMISALFCASSHLRPRAGEAMLIVAPRLADVAFLLQRLYIMRDCWIGPLYLAVLHGAAPTRADVERLPQLAPLLSEDAPEATFLEDFTGLAAEEQQGDGEAALRALLAGVLASTAGAGVDALLALDVDLAPPAPPPEMAALGVGAEGAPQASLLRSLLGCLALRGRLITNFRRLEIGPAEGEHLWAKEASVSFYNPHCLPTCGAQQGAALHGLAEVTQRVVCGELQLAEAEVAQFRMFEQFRQAYEAAMAPPAARGGGAPGRAAGTSPGGGLAAHAGGGSSQLVVLVP